MKNRKIWIPITIICVLFLLYYLWLGYKVTVSKAPVTIQPTGTHPANNRQYGASVWMDVCDGNLVFFPNPSNDGSLFATPYRGNLLEYSANGVNRLHSLNKGKSLNILGSFDGFLYYRVDVTGSYNYDLYCHNLNTGEDIRLFPREEDKNLQPPIDTNVMNASGVFYAEDGSVFFQLFPEHNKEILYVHVKGDTVLGVETLTQGYPLGDRVYYVVNGYADFPPRICYTEGDGVLKEIPLDKTAQDRAIIPTEHGLLIHNIRERSTSACFLYFIDTNYELHKLFSCEAMESTTAVTVWGDYAFFSILRYEGYQKDGILLRRFENDTVEGTYRINLDDYSTEKISDKMYDGLYNFDDNHLYACDRNCSIYQLDFDGNVVDTLFLVKSIPGFW